MYHNIQSQTILLSLCTDSSAIYSTIYNSQSTPYVYRTHSPPFHPLPPSTHPPPRQRHSTWAVQPQSQVTAATVEVCKQPPRRRRDCAIARRPTVHGTRPLSYTPSPRVPLQSPLPPSLFHSLLDPSEIDHGSHLCRHSSALSNSQLADPSNRTLFVQLYPSTAQNSTKRDPYRNSPLFVRLERTGSLKAVSTSAF